MGTTTSNFNLIKPAKEDFYDIADQNSNMDIIDGELKSLKDAGDTSKVSIDKLQADTVQNSSSIKNISELISSGAVQTPKLGMGANKVAIPDVPVSPRIEFTGMSYVNLLGKDGDCEDISKWYTEYAANTIDTASKVFGKSGFKVTVQGTKGYGYGGKILPIEKGKYYMFSAYMKNGNASEVHINLGGYGGSPIVTQTSAMQRVCGKWQANGSTNMSFNLIVVGSDGQYGYFDGGMLIEISASDYVLSDAELMAKYPYVESYGVLTNPYFENRRYNLVRNGNCEEGIGYWEASDSNSTLTLENDKFKLITTAPYSWRRQRIKVKRNTNYYFKANISGNGLTCVIDNAETNIVCYGNTSFNSGNATEVYILLHGGESAGTTYFDHIMLIEGTSAPTEYKSSDLQKFVLEGQFTQDDKVVIENGKVSGELNWKHETLYGKDYSWYIYRDYAGYKYIINDVRPDDNCVANSQTIVKFDGKILRNIPAAAAADLVFDSGDECVFNPSYPNKLGITVLDTNSGWNETIDPNNDEVTAYMNGWKAGTHNGTRYTGWVSVVDNTIPSSLVVTAAYGTNAGGQNKLNVVDSTKFAVNDWIYFVGDDKWVNTCQISAISGNQLTLTYNLTSNVSSANPIAKQDQTQIAWVKSNIAPNYKGYQIHYKLANPEPVTDSNAHIHGEIWDMVKGDNYLYVDSGIVLGETAEPKLDIDTYYIGIQSNRKIVNSPFKYPAQYVNRVYRNQIYDPKWALLKSDETQFGYAAILAANYDSYAAYTADYQILKTIHAQSFGSLALSYKQSIASTLEGHSKEIEQKQNKDSTLDTLIDLSIYEEINIPGSTFVSWFESNYFYCGLFIPFKATKKVIPLIKIVEYDIHNDGEGSIKSKAPIFVTSVTNYGFTVEVRITDINSKNNIKSHGAYFDKISVIADCRGRI